MPGGALEGLCPNCASKTEIQREKRAASTSTATPGVPAIPGAAQPDEQGLVTLLKCETLAEADAIRAALEAAGISVILPDEALMQTVAWNVNNFLDRRHRGVCIHP